MRADAVSLIEAAYDLEGDTQAGVRRVAKQFAPLTGLDHVVALAWRVARRKFEITQVHIEGVPLTDHEMASIVGETSQARLRATYVDIPPIAFASQMRSHTFNAKAGAPTMAAVTKRLEVDELVGVTGRATQHRGVMLSVRLRAGQTLERDRLRMWSRLAVHVGTGLRLHDRLRAAHAEPEAILSPSGRLLDARPAAKIARAELATATRAVDRARGKLRRVAPDEAVELWRALVRGEWSLVDQYDSDGRRFVFAHRNVPAERANTGLTERETRAVALLARGYANKLIAYELDLAPSTVAGLLRSACAKLGAHSTLELLARFKR